jgi:cob(I)alamin adenosyltransferase
VPQHAGKRWCSQIRVHLRTRHRFSSGIELLSAERAIRPLVRTCVLGHGDTDIGMTHEQVYRTRGRRRAWTAHASPASSASNRAADQRTARIGRARVAYIRRRRAARLTMSLRSTSGDVAGWHEICRRLSDFRMLIQVALGRVEEGIVIPP